MTEFDDGLLEADQVSARADEVLRAHASAGARIRREAQHSAADLAAGFEAGLRPRGVIALGPEARLVRALLEPVCPVPFMAWPHPGLPAWVGALDLVIALAPSGSDPMLVGSIAEAVRRGAAVLLAAQPDSTIAERAGSRQTLLLPVTTEDPLACVVQVLSVLHQLGLGPAVVPQHVAEAADLVAEESSPHRDSAVNPAKAIALALADAQALVWGGTVLAARASRRIAEALRRSSGRPALAADAAELLPVMESTQARDLFADPSDGADPSRTVVVVVDDPAADAPTRAERSRLMAAAEANDVRVVVIAPGPELEQASAMETYLTLLQKGLYAATWLGIGLGTLASDEGTARH